MHLFHQAVNAWVEAIPLYPIATQSLAPIGIAIGWLFRRYRYPIYAIQESRRKMNIAKWAFRIAGTIGLLQIVPLYFYEAQLAVDMPPALNHPEYYYGFIGVTLAWQIAFLVISTDPLRYRPLMPVAMLEKASFVLAAFWLLNQGRLPTMILAGALLDLVYGLGFVWAYLATRGQKWQS